MKPNLPRPGLQLKIVAWSFIPAAIILLGVGLLSFFLLREVIEVLMIENNRERTELMAEQIGGELAILTDQLKNVTRTPDLLGEDVSEPRTALHWAASSLESFDGGVVVLNRQGIVVAAEPARQDSPQEDWSDRPYFRQMVYSPGTILSDIHPDSPRGALVVSLAVPITAADGQFLGAIAGMFRVDSSGTSSLYRRLTQFSMWPSGYTLVGHAQPKSTYLVDHNGRIVSHTEASFVGEDVSSHSPVQAVLAGRRGPISSAEYRDQDVITYFAPVPNTGWGFLVEQRHSEVLSFYQRYFQLQTLLFALALIVPAGLVAFGVRHITEPIRQVTTASRQIAAGDLRQVTNVRTGDELEELANQFNRMSAQLRESYDALREREERLALVVRATNDGFWDWDLQTNHVYFSPRWKSMLGYAGDELGDTFDDWRRLVHPDDADRALGLIQDYLQGKASSYELEHRLQHKDGSFRWVLARGVALRDGSGHAYRMVGSHADITERKRSEAEREQAEEALRASEGNMRSLSENAQGFGIYRLAADPSNPYLARVVVASPSLKDLLGVSDLRDFATWFSNIHADDLPRIVDANRRSLVQGVPFDQTFRCIHSQQIGCTWVHVRSRPILDDQGKLAFFNGLVVDMTEQKRAEEALRQSEMRFRAVFEGAPIGIHVTSWDADTTDWSRHKFESNRAYQQVLGYTGDELARMHLEEFSHPADAAADRGLYREMLEGKRERYQIEKRYIAKEGRVFWGRYSASMVRDADANPHLMIGMVENIDDQKKAEQALQAAYQTLERRVEERTRELAVLNSIAATVSRSLDLKEIMRDALVQTIQFYGMDSGSAYELEEHTQSLVLIAHQGSSDDFAQRMSRLPLQVALAGRTPNADRPMVWQVAQDYPEGDLKQAMLHEGIQSIFAVPLMAKGKLVGAFAVRSKTQRVLTSEESALLAAVGQQVGVAVENAHLYQQAQRIATTAERSRLARELHDSVTQSLYSLMLYAEAAVRSLADKEIPEASDYLKELRDTAQNALREMRLLIFELRPLALEKNGLVAALRTRLNAVEGRGGMTTELQVDDSQKVEELPLALQEELYHITQEALNNVIRHAHAQSVAVRLQLSGGAIHLEIADDGIGFEPSRADENSGLGLSGMRERVQRVGGSMQIESVTGKGTLVTAQVPRVSPTRDNTVAGGAR